MTFSDRRLGPEDNASFHAELRQKNLEKLGKAPKFLLVTQILVEPCPCVSPTPISSSGRDAEDFSDLSKSEAGEVLQFDDFSRRFVDLRESDESFIEGEDLWVVRIVQRQTHVEVHALLVAAVLGPPFPQGIIDQNPAHGFRCRGEKVGAGIPMLGFFYVDEPKVGFVDQCRGLESLPGIFL